MSDPEDRLKLLEAEIERRLVERFAALRDEFDRLRLESDRRWAGFLDRFDQKFTGIVPPELVAPSFEPATAPATPSAGHLSLDEARRLDDAGNQVEILNRFLDLCRRHASRVALIVSRGGGLGVWKAVGFSDHDGNDEEARRASLPSAQGSVLPRVLEGTGSELGSHNVISAALGAEDATRAVLFPMVVKEKISGALYADCVPGEESRFDSSALSLLTFVAGLVVDRLALRKLTPAPALRSLEAAAPSPPPEIELELVPEGEAASKSEPEPAPPASAPPPAPQIYGAPTAEELELAPSESSWPGHAQPSPSTPTPSPRPATAPARPSSDVLGASVEEPKSAAPAAAPSVRSSSGAPRASTGARRLAGPLAPADTGDERRDEARRFAKLLVSEIKLYNEKLVQEGRQRGNLYELLKEDIDRSRQMYDERIPEDVRSSSNFFYDELVRTLADGKPESLGI